MAAGLSLTEASPRPTSPPPTPHAAPPPASPSAAPSRARAAWQFSAASVLAVRVGAAGLAYLAQVLMARLMGGPEYGTFATVWVWIAVLGHASSLGFGHGASRFVPHYRALADDAHLRGFLVAGLLVALAGGGTAGLLGAGLLGVRALGALPDGLGPLALALLVLPLFALQDYAEGIARALGWTVLAIAPPYLVRQGLIGAGMLVAVAAGAPARVEVAVACVVAATALALALQAALLAARLRRLVPPGPRRLRWREWTRTTGSIAFLDLALSGFNFVDVLALGLFEPPAAVGAYFAATRLLQFVLFVSFAASAATTPRFAEAHARGDRAGLVALVRRRARLATLAMLGGGLAILAASPWLLALFGPDFGAGVPLLAILLAGIVTHTAFGPADDLLAMLGAERLCAALVAAMLALALLLNLALVPALGATGAALAMALSWIARGAVLALAARRRLGIATPAFAGPQT